MFTSSAESTGTSRQGLAARLWAPFAALLLAVAGCGGGSTDSGGGAGTTPPPTGCDASSCSAVYVGLTDADGDFLSYSVDVVSLTLKKANGAMVETLPVATRVDFAELVDLTEFVTAATIPNGVYVEGRIRLDYTNAAISVEVNGTPREARVVGANGQPLGIVDLEIRLDDRNQVVIAPGRPAFLQLDFDLAASHAVDVATTPVTAVASPFIVATVEPVEDKEMRAGGPLVSVDTAASSYMIDVRPFHHRDARLGRLTVNTTGETAFEIDGESYTGAAGLAALALQPAGSPTIAFGVLSLADRTFTAERVHAGSSVPGPRFDVLQGNVVARAGNRLTVRGGTLIRRTDSVVFVRGDVTVLVGPDTRVTRDGMRGAFGIEAISVGQRIHAFGQASGAEGAITLDAQQGRVRLHLTHLVGTVVTAQPGQLTLDLAAIDGRRPGIFDFRGTGLSSEVDADPDNYEVATAALALDRLAAGSPARVFGFVTPFGAAPPDFNGRTVVDFQQVRAVLGIGWGMQGTAAPFVRLDAQGLVIDGTNRDIGLRHYIAIGPRLVDLTQLPASVTVVPAEGRGLYSIGEPGRVEVFAEFARFAARLSEKLGTGVKVRSMSASGSYDIGSSMLTARSVSVSLAGTG